MLSPKLLEAIEHIIVQAAVFAYQAGYEDHKMGRPVDERLKKGLSRPQKLQLRTELEKTLRRR